MALDPTATRKLVLGTLLVGASALPAGGVLATVVSAAGGVGGNWIAEAVGGVIGAGPPADEALRKAFARAVQAAAHELRRAYGDERVRRDGQDAFRLLRETAQSVTALELPPETSDILAVQRGLAGALAQLLHDFPDAQVLLVREQLLPATARAFQRELAHDAEAWRLYHGWLLQRMLLQSAALQAALATRPDARAELADAAGLEDHLDRFAQRLTALLAELHEALKRAATVAGGDGQEPPTVRMQMDVGAEGQIDGGRMRADAVEGPVDMRMQGGDKSVIKHSDMIATGVRRRAPAPLAPGSVPARPAPPAHDRGPLPATLSADGVHFTYGHALLIGVGQYQDPGIADVATTANDARALATLLRDPQRAAYPDAQVRVLLDARATRATILDELEALAQRLAGAPGGTALIFFAGHGTPVDGSYALLPHDAVWRDLAQTSLSAALFHSRIAKIRANAKRLVIVLNCCHAGGVGDAVLTGDSALRSGAAPPPEFYRPLATGSGQVVISSSRPAQKSGARSTQRPQHTTFGAHLLAALEGGASGQGPAIGVFDLFAHLRASVPADARSLWHQGAPLVQEPLFYASQLDDNLPVALRPAGAPGTLGAGEDLAARLVALELELEALGEALPAALRAERDALLARLARGS